MDNGNEPAYPMTEDSPRTGPRTWYGLTKRELFAAMAMQGVVSADDENNIVAERAAKWSVELADALLAELAKE